MDHHCHLGPSLSEVPAKGRGEAARGGLCSAQPPPPPAQRAEHRGTEGQRPPEMLFPGCRFRALSSLCFCVLVLACIVGEEEWVGGCGDPDAAWGVSVTGCEACRCPCMSGSMCQERPCVNSVHGVGTDDSDHEYAFVCVSADEYAVMVNV